MATTVATPAHVLEKGESGLWSWITTVDHKRIGALYGVTAFIFFIIGGFTYVGGGGWIATSIILAFAVPSTIAIFLRLIYRVDVISIFGKRSRATIRFSFKKQQARELYGRLCHRTRQVQTNIEESNRLIDAAEKPPNETPIDPSLLPPPIAEPEQESIG